MINFNTVKRKKYTLGVIAGRKFHGQESRAIWYHSDKLEDLIIKMEAIKKRKGEYWEWLQLMKSVGSYDSQTLLTIPLYRLK